MATNLGWTAEDDAKLIALRAKGFRSGLVAAEMGRGRSCVQDRARALGLPFARPTPKNVLQWNCTQKFRDMPAKAPSGFVPLNIPFMDLGDGHCREVVGTGADGLADYCGHNQKAGSSYCPHHSAINEIISTPKSFSHPRGRAA